MAAGVFQGMPVGGSLSATALSKQAGARSRQALVIAGLLMLIGYRTISPRICNRSGGPGRCRGSCS